MVAIHSLSNRGCSGMLETAEHPKPSTTTLDLEECTLQKERGSVCGQQRHRCLGPLGDSQYW